MIPAHAHMLEEALRLAERGVYVIPLHAPLFDQAGALTGCTCEAWKRSDGYRRWLEVKGMAGRFDPNFTCRTPGKHPRLSKWEDEASTDPTIIRSWFAKWPTLNLGVAPGKSGLLMVDGDKYKADYAGADLLSLEDEQTPTTLSGGGGAHWYYQMPEGKAYGNATGDLPPGIDIRGVGGMTVVYPSIHPSGRRYEWEIDYSIFDIAPRPLPAQLVTILDGAQEKSVKAKAVTFSIPTTTPPELSVWRLSKKTLGLIHTPHTPGKRSEADMSVCVALAYAGATDDDILSVFEHRPIGKDGKFADAGRVYLAHTIGKARTFVEQNPRPDVGATIEALRLWIRTHSFEGFAPASADGVYRTDSVDTKIADAVLDAMRADDRLDIVIGKKRLGKLAGTSCNTAQAALNRLAGWLFDVTPDPMGARVALVENCRFQQIDPSLSLSFVTKRDQSTQNDKIINEYTPRKATDPFLTGVSRYTKKQAAKVAIALDITTKEAKKQYTFASFGEAGLRVLDALLRAGDMTAQELVEETGKKLSAIRAACARLVAQGLVEATREGSRGPKVYGVADNVWERLDAITPHLRTYKLSEQREDDRLVASIQWSQRELKATQEPEEQERLDGKIKALKALREPILARLHDDLRPQAITQLAHNVSMPFGPHPATQAKLERLHSEARIDARKQRFDEQLRLVDQIHRLRAQGDGKREIARKLAFANYPTKEIWAAINQAWGPSTPR